MPGAQHLQVERQQPPQRAQIGGQRALAGGDEDAPRPEHRVPGEADAPGEEANAVGRVARRGQRRERADLLALTRQDDRDTERVSALRVVQVGVGEHDAARPVRPPSGRPPRAPDRPGRGPPPSRRPHTCSCPRASAARGCSPSRDRTPAGLSVPNLHARIIAEVSSNQFGLARTVAFSGRAEHVRRRTAVVTAIAVLNLVVGDRAVLVELLIAGPLVAAAGTSPERTAVVALYALVLSLPLGLAGDTFGSLQHLVGVAAVATGGVLAVAPRPASRASRGPARPRAGRAPGGHPRTGRARGHAQRDRRRRDRTGAGRQPDLRERRGPRDPRLRLPRGDDGHRAAGEILARYDLYEESGSPFPAERLPGRLALAGEGGGEAIIRFRVRATGEERWSVVKSTPVYDGDGLPPAWRST